MIHLRLTCPAGLSDEVLTLLEHHAGVENLVVARGVVHLPAGDAFQCDVARPHANQLIEALQATGLTHGGSLVAENIDAAIDRTGAPTGSLRSRFREFPPIWAMVEARVTEGGTYPTSWFALMAIAGVIGSVGILTNSQILIVGAMVVGPEYGAIIAMAWGVTQRERPRVRDAFLALSFGFAIAIVASLLFGLFIRAIGQTPPAFTQGVRPVSDFINTPNVFSFAVAVVAGIVGVVSLTTARAATMIGVFISVTTIPAAADMGLSAAYGSANEIGGSTLQLLMNVVVLTVVGILGLRFQHRFWSQLAAPS